MGIYSRDYLRDDPQGYAPRPGGSREVWKTLIIINVVVFLADFVTRTRQFSLIDWLSLDPTKVLHGQIWRLVTHAFCHGGIIHILFNMLFLFFFGRPLELMFGSREFLFFYFAGLLAAAFAFLGFGIAMNDLTPAVGASGAIMAVVMAFAVHFPRQKVYFYGIIPVEIRWLVVLYVIYDGFPVLTALAHGGKVTNDGIAHAAHLGGLLFGFLYVKNHWRLEPLLTGFRLPKRRPRVRKDLRVYEPPREQTTPTPRNTAIDEQVDAILAKIHEQGEAALTDRERNILKQASERYKQR